MKSDPYRLGRNEYMRRWRLTPAGQAQERRRHHKIKTDPALRAQRSVANKAYRLLNRTRLEVYQAQWRKGNPMKLQALRLKKYGLTVEQYVEMAAKQNNACAICLKSSVSLHVDHNHATGAVRGLLCGHCNHGLGKFGEDTAVMRRAIDYLAAPTPCASLGR